MWIRPMPPAMAKLEACRSRAPGAAEVVAEIPASPDRGGGGDGTAAATSEALGMLERVSVMSVLQLWGFDRARAYPGLYPAMYPLSGQQSPHMQRSAALLQAGFDRLGREGALATGITPQLANAVLRAALRGVAHAVAAQPNSRDVHQVSATVRDAIISRLIAPRQLITQEQKDGTTHG